jgi:hypothetical protein
MNVVFSQQHQILDTCTAKGGDMTAIPAIPEKYSSSRQLSAPYLLSGCKDSFDLNLLPALGAPFALLGDEVSHGERLEWR